MPIFIVSKYLEQVVVFGAEGDSILLWIELKLVVMVFSPITAYYIMQSHEIARFIEQQKSYMKQ